MKAESRYLDLRLRRYAENLRREAAPSRDLHARLMQRLAKTAAGSPGSAASAAVEASQTAQGWPRLGLVRASATMAAFLLVGAVIGLMRMALSPASVTEGTWSSAPSMAVPRAYHTATLLPNGKVLVVGGRGPVEISAPWQRAGSAIASAELYEPKTRTWSSAGTLSTPRFAHTATLLKNGRVLVVGGNPTLPNASLPTGVDTLSSAELYDPQTNAWSLAASMHMPRSFHTATLLPDGRVLVAGGIESSSADPGHVLASAELYDATANTWTAAAPMLAARANQSAILLSDHRVLVVGGIDHTFDFPGATPTTGLSTADLYVPATDSWSPAPSLGYARISPSSTLLPDGRVLVVGDGGVNARTAEIFDPANERWSPSPKPAVGRTAHVAVPLRGGSVLVAGGIAETSAQLFDWHRNIWSSAGALAEVRSGATATVLNNGQVLIVGGFGSGSAPRASAEVYDPAATRASALAPRTSARVPWGEVAPLIAIVVLLLGLGLWVVRRRQAVWSAPGDNWIDP